MNTLLLNSLLTAACATLLATLLGFVAALVLVSLPTALRRFALAASLGALALPPFLVTNCWLHYLGNTGVWRSWLPFDIFGFGGVVWIFTLMFWPISLVAALGAWRSLDATHFEAEPGLRGARLIRWLLWPSARNLVTCGAVLTFALALNQFSVPAILQVKVLPVEAWIQFSTALKPGHALAVSWPVIILPIVALVVFGALDISWPAQTATAPAVLVRRQLGMSWFGVAAAVTVLALLLSVGLPLTQLLGSQRTWSELSPAWRASWPVALNSFVFAGGGATVALAVGLLTWRYRTVSVLWGLFLVPGMLLAVGIIWLLNRPGIDIVYRSLPVVMLALALRYAAPVWVLVRRSFRASDTSLLDAARLEGLSRWAIFRHVYCPRALPVGVGAWYVAYLLCLWDVETVMLLYPPGAETLALRIFNLLHYGHDAQVDALCSMLLGVGLAPALVYAALRHVGRLPTFPAPFR